MSTRPDFIASPHGYCVLCGVPLPPYKRRYCDAICATEGAQLHQAYRNDRHYTGNGRRLGTIGARWQAAGRDTSSITAEMSNTTPLVSADSTPANLGEEDHASSNTNARPGHRRGADGYRARNTRAAFPRPAEPSAHRQVATTGQGVRTVGGASLPAARPSD
jgi:hypothetical protein